MGQEDFAPFPEKGKFSVQQWAAILKRDIETVSCHLEEKQVPCIPFGTLVIVDAEDLWATLPRIPYRRKKRPRKDCDNGKPQKGKRRRNDLPHS